jgi:hypothetical protein
MEVPERFVKFVSSYRGQTSEEGWVEIDVKALDLEGVSRIYVNLAHVASKRGKADEAASLLDKWDAVFGDRDEVEG